MRFLTFLALSFFISLNTYSQGWIDGGIKGGLGVTQLINQNVWDNTEVVNKISYGKSFGGKLGLNFNLNYQITLDFIYTMASQEYEFQPNNSGVDTWSKHISYNSFDMPFLFRRNSDNGSFFEIGPQISFIKQVEQDINGATTDIENRFAKTNFGAVVGVGSFMMGSENLYLVFGLRAHYGFQDILSADGGKNSNKYLPVQGTELDDGDNIFQFEDYKKTSPISLLAYLEVNYDLAYIVRSNCKRSAIKFF
jgi:hypothetical protein